MHLAEMQSPLSMEGGLKRLDMINNEMYGMLSLDGLDLAGFEGHLGRAGTGSRNGAQSDPINSEVVDPADDGVADPLTPAVCDVVHGACTITNPLKTAHSADGVNKEDGVTKQARSGEGKSGEDVGIFIPNSVAGDSEGDEVSLGSEEESEGDTGIGKLVQPTEEMADPSIVAAKMKLMEGMLALLDNKSTRLEDTVMSLDDSLEYSYKEIADLKKENENLRLLMTNLEIEDKRTQIQVNDVTEKLDRLDSVTKKRNLLFEGIPETVGKRENINAVISAVFDQLSIPDGINFDACNRFGPTTKDKPRLLPLRGKLTGT